MTRRQWRTLTAADAGMALVVVTALAATGAPWGPVVLLMVYLAARVARRSRHKLQRVRRVEAHRQDVGALPEPRTN